MSIVLIIAFAALGAVLASFSGVISERIYTGQSWTKGRSRCNSCRRQLTALDLVPIFSWIAFRGRCRTCRSRVPAMYALYEASLALIFASSYVKLGFTLALAVFLATVVILGFIVLYDLRHTIVPFESSLLLASFSLLFLVLTVTNATAFLEVLATATIIGIGFFLMYALSKGRAMGLGDAPVAFALSLLVGSQAVTGLLFSFWIGAVVGILILVLRRGGPRMGIEVPFVPFLAIGYLLAFFTQWNPFLF